MIENTNEYINEIFEYYTELIKITYLKEDQTLGINARNKVIANYNRMVTTEKIAYINGLITRIGNEEIIAHLATSAYINTVKNHSQLLNVYANIKIYVALKKVFDGYTIDPLHVISAFDPSIWQQENIQSYANAALEYNKYHSMLSNATKMINEQTNVK